ncbi:hypothetical protein NW762_008182 [Fusarium torreyae]|uniref:Uncharacterized protein n=1 Tax=Fusarium torreyae TaxID=1237075 RepID=A0A9W8RVU8_9HYPO|nr:hypothetical protein NW762_008182 [Fusarium torreyae]
MNYANMIEEKNLKKTFIIATLCSTIAGTFSSSIGLWDRVKEKRKQAKRDTTQDEEIKKLRAQVEQSSKDKERALERSRTRDEVEASFERSGALINREFEDGYQRFGRRFAIGDVVTENKLQAQVIAMQQTVINVLQDALYNGRQLDRVDMARLIAASDAAREGSLGALRQQQQRLLADEPQPPPQLALPPPKRASTIVQADPLYCRYGLDLQYIPERPLSSSFAPGGDRLCPACDVFLDVEADDGWAIGKTASRWITEQGYRREIDEELEFHVDPRFVVKCHTPEGEFACVLCTRFRDEDVICPTADTLINHIGREHTVAEMEREVDFKVRSLDLDRRSLPPRRTSPPARSVDMNKRIMPPPPRSIDSDRRSSSGRSVAADRRSLRAMSVDRRSVY